MYPVGFSTFNTPIDQYTHYEYIDLLRTLNIGLLCAQVNSASYPQWHSTWDGK